MNNRGRVLPRDYIIGIVVFMIVTMGIIMMFSEFRKSDPNYPNSSDWDTFEDTFDKYDETVSSVDELESSATNIKDSGWGVLGLRVFHRASAPALPAITARSCFWV